MSLARLLSDQQTRLDKLIALMEHERSLLTQGHIDGSRLARIAEDKQTLLAELESMETLRHSVQKRLGYPDSPDGARQSATDAGCARSWQALLEKSERVARMNEQVGQMVSLRMTHNQRMLDYIHRLAEKTLYTPDGRNSAQSGRISASA
ncbi:hypothetical protein GCM10022228_12080 [Halomonas cibimaris]|uniref:Flagellar protein FlgN n=1 Tax=Halomonas cibimaris TaxID=657012 RepID=A0ABP7LK16_9GAMM